MNSFVIRQEEVEILDSTVLLTMKVNLRPRAELALELTDEVKAKILADIPTAKFDVPSQSFDLHGTNFSLPNPLTGEHEIFSHDLVLAAFPDVNFDEIALEYESELKWIKGASFTHEELQQELERRRLSHGQ